MTRFVSIWAELLTVAPGKFTALPARSARSSAEVEKWKVGEGRVYSAAHGRQPRAVPVRQQELWGGERGMGFL